MSPLISIIIPCYNAGDKLRASVDSVLAQPRELFECWIIDGGSTDGSLHPVQEIKAESLHWISESDQGVYDAMNKGIGLSRGKFFYFLGAGDLLMPGVLQKLADFIGTLPKENPRLVYGNVRFMRDGGRVGDGFFDRKKMCDLNVCHQGAFYEREIHSLIGNYSLKYKIFADWVYNLQCFGDHRITCYYWDQVIADYEGGGLSDRGVDEPFNRDRIGLIRRYLGWREALGYWSRSVLKPILKKVLGRR